VDGVSKIFIFELGIGTSIEVKVIHRSYTKIICLPLRCWVL